MSALQAKHITKMYGALKAVDDVSLDIEPNTTLAIVGESGSGKTTLAKICAGLIPADQGEIISQSKVQMVFQDPYSSLDPMYPIRFCLQEAFYGQKDISPQEQRTRMAEMLVRVGLENDVLMRYPHEFSGGQRQRIAIARVLLSGARILVLDEITSALDVLVQKKILDLLSDLKQERALTYILISHNLRVVKHFADKIAVMHNGKIIEQGAASRIFESPAHRYTRQLITAAFEYRVEE